MVDNFQEMTKEQEAILGESTPAAVADKLTVHEIFYSIQGESSYMGLPCVFVRLTACNLRCAYCDTEYAFYEGRDMTIEEILSRVTSFGCDLVEVTGGEPLLQSAVITLIRELIKNGKEVLVETGGSLDISSLPRQTVIILDIKTPGSKMEHKNLWSNLDHLKASDQIKFVVCDRGDYEWSRDIIRQHRLDERFHLLISPVHGGNLSDLASWILEDQLKVRLQIQLHKYIWGADARGV
ncbi:MAG TPA: radical SAM protein [Acidobacteriota bacterium]